MWCCSKVCQPENVPYIWLSRATILAVILATVVLVAVGRRWKRSLPA